MRNPVRRRGFCPPPPVPFFWCQVGQRGPGSCLHWGPPQDAGAPRRGQKGLPSDCIRFEYCGAMRALGPHGGTISSLRRVPVRPLRLPGLVQSPLRRRVGPWNTVRTAVPLHQPPPLTSLMFSCLAPLALCTRMSLTRGVLSECGTPPPPPLRLPSPAPNCRKPLIFTDHHNKEPPNSTVPKACPGWLARV